MSACRSALLWALVLFPAALSAQGSPRAGAFEIGGGAGWIGGSPAGDATASETRNQTGVAALLTLFEADARLRPTGAYGARVGFHLTPTTSVEAGFSYSRPTVAIAVSGDFEDSPDVTIDASSLRQYVVDLGVVVHLRRLRFGRDGVPFFSAGAGYLRELTDERALAGTGRVYRIGGGLKQRLGPRGGLRFDAGLGVRDGGFSLDEPRLRAFFTAGAGAFLVF